MARRLFLGTSLVAAALFGLGLGGCSSGNGDAPSAGGSLSPTSTGDAPTDFCGATAHVPERCSGETATACDEAMLSGCDKLDGVLSPSLLDQAGQCIAKAECDKTTTPARGCLTEALGAMKPTDVQKDLAEAYCSACAGSGSGSSGDCVSSFFDTKGEKAILAQVVLPMADQVAKDIKAKCVKPQCGSSFLSCAQWVAENQLTDALSAEGAHCVLTALSGDDVSNPTIGGDGSSGSGGTSDAGTGGPSPNAMYQLVIVSGEVPAKKVDGSSWDAFGGLPDPFLTITLATSDTAKNQTVKTSTKSDTLTPEWNETVASSLTSDDISSVQLVMTDADLTSYTNDAIGDCTASLTLASGTQTVSCPASGGGPGFTVKYELKPQ